MSDAMTSFMLRIVIMMTGVLIGLAIAIAASFGTFETIVTAFLAMITVLLANYLGD